MQAPSAGAKRRSPDRDKSSTGSTAAPAAPEALMQRLTLAAPDPTQTVDPGHSPPAAGKPGGASHKEEPGGGDSFAVEGGAREAGASWRLPLAAADAPFTAQEARPLGRNGEGEAISGAPARLPPVGRLTSLHLGARHTRPYVAATGSFSAQTLALCPRICWCAYCRSRLV